MTFDEIRGLDAGTVLYTAFLEDDGQSVNVSIEPLSFRGRTRHGEEHYVITGDGTHYLPEHVHRTEAEARRWVIKKLADTIRRSQEAAVELACETP